MSELYAFMDGADTTLARKVLGEGGDEDGGGAAEGDAAAGGAGGRHMCQLRNWLPVACASLLAAVVYTPGKGPSAVMPAHLSCPTDCAPAPGPGGDAPGGERDDDAYRRALYDAMSCMRDVRKRSERTDAMFEPLRETVTALQGAGVALPDGVLRQVRRVGLSGSWRLECMAGRARRHGEVIARGCAHM